MGRAKHVTLGPDGVYNNGIARSNDQCWQHKQHQCYQRHVHFPLEFRQLYPALNSSCTNKEDIYFH